MSTIIIKNSANSGSIPPSLIQGEFAINVLDGRLFYGSGSNNDVQEFGVTSSYALNAESASYAVSSSFSNRSISASYSSTSSYVKNAQTASYVLQAVSSSFSSTSSISISASYALSASHALNGGVTQIIAGDNITLSPLGGLGIVTVNAVIPSSSLNSNTTGSFTNQSTWVLNHNLGSSLVVVQTYDASYNQIIPKSITLTDINTSTITFDTPVSGYAIASVGGNFSGSSVFPYTGLAEIIGNLVITGSSIITGSLDVTNGITGSLQGTSSYAISSSYALTASYALSGGSNTAGLPPRFILSGSEYTINEGLQAEVYDVYNYGTFTLQSGSVVLPLGSTFITNDPLLSVKDQLYNTGVINNGGIIQYI